MRVFALVSALLALAGVQGSAPEPLRLKAGDSIAVTGPYGGEFKIMPDGAIYGRGFGRLVLQGQTWQEAQDSLRKALHRFVRDEAVNVTLKELRRDQVYLVGMSGGKGPVELTPKLSLRQLLGSANLEENTDQLEVQLFRGTIKICSCNAAQLLSGSSADQVLQPDDVVTIAPAPFVRVWVTGLVTKSGQLKVPAGTDVYRAIAEAGGLSTVDLESDTAVEQDGRILVRRGLTTIELPLRQDQKAAAVMLEAGDTVSVVAPEQRRITLAGEVAKPGEILMRGEHSITGAIAMAGGCDAEGSLANVLVLRKGDLYQVDATTPLDAKTLKPFSLESGDLVYIQRNLRSILILGEVEKPGKIPMKDGKTYHLSDALAEAGGLSSRGTMRRVYVGHPNATGKMVVAQYNLDEFLKDGKLTSDPLLEPGDCILFGEPKGLTLGSVSQFLSNAILFESFAGATHR
jgi:protein involved in polysaccharide export with SLBB domain